MRTPHIWTQREIRALPEFGDVGWFYGLVRTRKRGGGLFEIFPGLGYGSAWPMWHPQSWWWALKDVFTRHPSDFPPGPHPHPRSDAVLSGTTATNAFVTFEELFGVSLESDERS